jgi:hypothetical protein
VNLLQQDVVASSCGSTAVVAGAEADAFSLAVWSDLSTAGGFRRIADLWTDGVAQIAWSCNKDAADSVRNGSSSSRFSSAAAAAAADADAVEGTLQQQQQQEESELLSQFPNNSPPNYPSPCLLGSPFTTLAVTHNYHSLLHAEPREHPFSYIMWLDVLGPGSEMQVCKFGTQYTLCSLEVSLPDSPALRLPMVFSMGFFLPMLGLVHRVGLDAGAWQ